MQVDNIKSNTNFKGRFIQNEYLERAIKRAKKSDKKRFLELQKKIEGVKDSFVYKLDCETSCIDLEKFTKTKHFHILRNSPHSDDYLFLDRKEISMFEYVQDEDIFYEKILKKVCKTLENIYPQFAKKSLLKLFNHKPSALDWSKFD